MWMLLLHLYLRNRPDPYFSHFDDRSSQLQCPDLYPGLLVPSYGVDRGLNPLEVIDLISLPPLPRKPLKMIELIKNYYDEKGTVSRQRPQQSNPANPVDNGRRDDAGIGLNWGEEIKEEWGKS